MKQTNDIKYDLIIKNDNSCKDIKCNAIELLKSNPKLVVYGNKNKLYELDNIQSLYLYPLTIIDYINNLTDKNIINLSIIEIDYNLDYKSIFGVSKFDKLKSVEILIKEDYGQKEISKICEIIEYFYNKNIMINLNIKNLIDISDLISRCYKHITYFKILFPNNFDNNLYKVF